MSLFHNAKHKLRHIRRTIDGLLNGDFPIESGSEALKQLQKVFASIEAKLMRASKLKDDSTISQIAHNINLKIIQVLPLLGFILRSTNVRNAFELLEPLQDLAKRTLQGRGLLILSSEWDYVPFAYPQSVDDLKSFVLIGLPASEAASALLVPLAAHELGHAIWKNRGVEGQVQTTLQFQCDTFYKDNMTEFKQKFPDYDESDLVGKDVLVDAIALSLQYGALQAEEIFCDLFAYACFGASYVHAFAYILSPGSGHRDPKYPSIETRIGAIAKIAKSEAVSVPTLNGLNFSQEILRVDARNKFIVRGAEESVATVIPGIWKEVIAVVEKVGVRRPNEESANRHVKEFRLGIPSPAPQSLGEIISAGWLRRAEIVASSASAEDASTKMDQLNELLLKSVEILEYRRRVGG